MSEKTLSSIVEYIGKDNGHRCGYCKGKSSNLSHGMWAHTLTVQSYENLINRGWRRSGHYCYKPLMNVTCCPQYTIRCNALDFQLNNSHKKVLKKFKTFVSKDDIAKSQQTTLPPGTSSFPNPSNAETKNTVTTNLAISSAKVPHTAHRDSPKTLEDFMSQIDNNHVHSLSIRLVDSTSNEFKETIGVSHELYKKYQMHIHKDKEDDCSMEQFQRFLVMSPLQKETQTLPNKEMVTFGSFHQQYWLDGNLIAVGVIDILPTCLSSVYFFYDPDYSFLSLGTFASLREICFVRELSIKIPNMCWYYLGFYIHSCPKMVYKGQYKPSFLLCPETYRFKPFNEAVVKLGESKYSRLDESADNYKPKADIQKVKILFGRRAISFSKYCSLRSPDLDELKEIEEYTELVGETCACHLLLYRC